MNENQAVKVIRKAREAARLRNSNAFIIDPNTGSPRTNAISLEPIPRKYLIALNGQAYNARSLAKMIASKITKVPHTRRTLGVKNVHENFFGNEKNSKKTEIERIMSKINPSITYSIRQFMTKSKKEAADKTEYSSFETIGKKVEIGTYFKNGKITDAFVQHPDFELALEGSKYEKFWNVENANPDKIAAVEQMLREVQKGSGYPICAVNGFKVGNRNYGSVMNNMIMSTKERIGFSKVLRMVERLCM